jgi:hypothetical protein
VRERDERANEREGERERESERERQSDKRMFHEKLIIKKHDNRRERDDKRI